MKPNLCTTYTFARVVQICALVGSVLIAGAQKIPVQKLTSFWPFAGNVVRWLQSTEWWTIPALVVIAGACAALRRFIGPPWIWVTIEKVLEEFRRFSFNDDGEPHQHRVTLLKLQRFYFPVFPGRWRGRFSPWGKGRHPCSGWLVPICRSGHVRQRSTSAFLAPDDAEHAEGVAGQAYNRGGYRIEELPDPIRLKSDDAMQEYADATHVPIDWVRGRVAKIKPFSRSLCGIRIEVDGKPWGVLVLDSTQPNAIKSQRTIDSNFRIVARVFAELLRKV